MLDSNGYLKIIDFGLSKAMASDQLATTQCGTSEYISPELVNNLGYNFPADWWSVGIITYELVFGRTPFHSKNKREMFINIIQKEVNFPTLGSKLKNVHSP